MSSIEPVAQHRTPRRWPLFFVGLLLFFVGPPLYFLQLHQGLIFIPWYIPLLTTLGVVCAGISWQRRRGVLRGVGVVALVALCAFEWFMLTVGSTTPTYTGPAQVGRKVPDFATTLADGSAFSIHDLDNGARTALVFFRGRW